MKNADALSFFEKSPAALPLYEELEQKILSEMDGVTIRVQKTQIAFACRRNFAFVSFLPVRRAKDRPESYITVTFGLGYQKESPRVDAVVEPCPNRWTHHVLISSVGEIDEELMGWLREASDFSASKR